MKPVLMFTIATILCLSGLWFGWRADTQLHIWVFDVGQGDGIFIRTPSGLTILVDGGPGDAVLSELGSTLPPWVHELDVVVLTHPHADHYEGLFEIVDRYEVGMFLVPEVCEYDSVSQELLEKVNFENVKLVYVSQEVGVSMVSGGDLCVLSVSIYGDFGESRDRSDVNGCSLVVSVEYGTFHALLTGDLTQSGEESLLKSEWRSNVRAVDVLKAGHHCSHTSSGESFLRMASPELAICSVGADNSFGHPHKEILERFDALGLEYLRTDEWGTIEIVSDGNEWWIED